MIGQVKIEFSKAKLNELLTNGKQDDAKTYIKDYFVKIGNPTGILKWAPSQNKYLPVAKADMTMYLPIHGAGNKKFDAAKWFLYEDADIYYQGVETGQGKVYEKMGISYINLFSGYLHTEQKKYSDYPKDIRDHVDVIWNHIYEVLCNKNQKLYEYVKNWHMWMISGKKMETALYLKAPQGVGKTTISGFIESKVLGHQIVKVAEDPDVVCGQFNAQLKGKVLLILEEMPSQSTNQWHQLGNSLKKKITDKTFEIKEKYGTPYDVANCLSIMMITNNEAMKLENGDRRWAVLDLSSHRIGDVAYFNRLYEAVENDTVGEAFYWYCKEQTKDKKFNERIIPETQNKKDLIIDNLHSLWTFIKEEYVLHSKALELPFKQFFDHYTQYCKTQKLKEISKIEISKILSTGGLPITVGTSNIKQLKYSAPILLEFFKKKRWMHETDEFATEEPETKQPIKAQKFKEYAFDTENPLEHGVEPIEEPKVTKINFTKEVLQLRKSTDLKIKSGEKTIQLIKAKVSPKPTPPPVVEEEEFDEDFSTILNLI